MTTRHLTYKFNIRTSIIKVIYPILTTLLLYSCYNEPSNKHSYEKNQIAKISNDSIENNLKSQLKEYLTAFYGEDPETAIRYCYPDMFIWMKKNLPDDYNMDLVKDVFRETVRDIKRSAIKNNLTIKFEVGEITKKIDLETDKLYTVVVYFIAKKKFDEVKTGGEVIGISNDNGLNWKFLDKSPESAPDILRMKFNESIVNQIMSENK